VLPLIDLPMLVSYKRRLERAGLSSGLPSEIATTRNRATFRSKRNGYGPDSCLYANIGQVLIYFKA
jgi:hypothetical protein